MTRIHPEDASKGVCIGISCVFFDQKNEGK
jgi:hypothetical protein